MARLHRQPLCVASALVVPMVTIASPSWLAIDGVGPCWAVLWLLPWALVDGPVSGAVAGASVGLVLDGLSQDQMTQVPALLVLGWWWGRLGRRAGVVQRSLNLGFLAWLGALIVGLTVLAQFLLGVESEHAQMLVRWGLQTLACQVLITGILAPLLVSLQLLIWRRRALG